MKKFFSFLILLFLIPTSVFADMGPKPEMNIRVYNLPQGFKIYLSCDNYKDYNLYEEEKIGEPEFLKFADEHKLIVHRESEGGIPIWLRVSETKGYDTYNYSYRVPSKFKIAVINSKGEVSYSNEVEVKAFNEEFSFNYENMQIKRNYFLLALYSLQFLKTFVITLILEVGFLYLVGYRTKRDLRKIVILNLITQILLNVILTYALIKSGSFFALTIIIPVEIFIFALEGVYLGATLESFGKFRNTVSVIIANLISFGIGFYIIK